MKKTYHGSCHCGQVRFEVDLDLSAGTHKCNCSICRKHRLWQAMAAPGDIRFAQGKDSLREYRFGSRLGVHLSCPTCGTHVLGRFEGELPDGKTMGVRLHSLDDLSPQELLAAPVTIHDGIHNAYDREPAEVRHL